MSKITLLFLGVFLPMRYAQYIGSDNQEIQGEWFRLCRVASMTKALSFCDFNALWFSTDL